MAAATTAPATTEGSVAESRGSFGWSEPSRSPEHTLTVRDAFRKIRRKNLSRVVRTVVAGSLVVCFAALGSVAVRAAGKGELEVTHAARVATMRSELTASFRTIHDDVAAPRVHAAPTRRAAPRHSHRGS
jgi:hypothetical protein